MNNKALFGIFAIALIGIGSVAAFGMGMTEEHREAIHEAVEAGDYDSWKAMHEEMLTEEHFAEIQEMHSLREEIREAYEAGDMETAQELKAEFADIMPEHGKGKGMAYQKGFKQGTRFGHNLEGGCPFADAE